MTENLYGKDEHTILYNNRGGVWCGVVCSVQQSFSYFTPVAGTVVNIRKCNSWLEPTSKQDLQEYPCLSLKVLLLKNKIGKIHSRINK